MFIKRLLLKGFNRISHNNIKTLEVDFTSPFQLVLGRNGSGKSSILSQLTLFPSNKKDFDVDGYRLLETQDNEGNTWIIEDDFTLGKHTLTKNDEVLFDNNNPTMQKQVIGQLFNLDKTIVDILTDQVVFTKMTPQQRRSIIMKASGINIDLGLQLLDKVKDRNSYVKQYSKNLSKRLVDEENALPTQTHIGNLNRRREDILEDLKLLDELAIAQPETLNENILIDKIETLKRRAKYEAIRFMDTPSVIYKCNDENEARIIQAKFESKIELIEQQQEEISEQISNLKLNLGQMVGGNFQELKKELDKLESEILDILSQSNGFIAKGEGYRSAVSTCQSIYESLRDIFNSLMDNSNNYFNKDRRQENIDRITLLGNEIHILKQSIYEFEHELKLHKTGDVINCPKCNHDFILGVKVSEAELKHRVEANTIKLSKLEKELELEKEYQAEITQYQNLLLQIEQLRKQNPLHEKLFIKLKEYNYVVNPPSHCSSIIEQWFTDMGITLRYNELEQRSTEIKEALKNLAMQDNERRKADEEKLEQLHNQYNHLIDEKARYMDEVLAIGEYLKYVARLRQWLGEVSILEAELSECVALNLAKLQHEFVFESKMLLNNELTTVDNEISSVTYATLNRDKLLKDKQEADEQKEYFDILSNELSPKTGLLGEAMNGFIQEFVSKMNKIISTVFTYPMEILPCRNKKGDLDFYFPVKINDNCDLIKEDVSCTSKGETKIIDFAFKILIMKSYGLVHYPLFLDEFTDGMDDTHRFKLIKVVYDMVETQMCSQLFIILHDASQYGVFTQAEILVVNPDNLKTIPEISNRHAKIN